MYLFTMEMPPFLLELNSIYYKIILDRNYCQVFFLAKIKIPELNLL